MYHSIAQRLELQDHPSYLVFTEKSKFSFYFILFRRFAVNRVTVLEPKDKRLFVTEYFILFILYFFGVVRLIE